MLLLCDVWLYIYIYIYKLVSEVLVLFFNEVPKMNPRPLSTLFLNLKNLPVNMGKIPPLLGKN